MKILQQHQLYACFSKCSFGVTEIEYLGHTLSGQGVAMDTTKLDAIRTWPLPTNLKQLHGFLGLLGYYCRFVKSYVQLAVPLTNLLKQDSFKWTTATTTTFSNLKEALMIAHVSAIPNFLEPFILEIDASGSGTVAVLSQGNHPIAYFSKMLSMCM